MKSLEVDLAGIRLWQNIARGNRRTSARQQGYRADQAEQCHAPRRSPKADVAQFLIEGINCPPKGSQHRPVLFRVSHGRDRDRNREDTRIFLDISISEDHHPIEIALQL